MDLGSAGLKQQPFRVHGKPLVFVGYAAQQRAFDFLHNTYGHRNGLGLFQGPSLSGKTTIIQHFAEEQREACAVAVVNGAGLGVTALLETVLREFGYEYKFNSVNELMSMLRVFLQQQASHGETPLLFIENAHEIKPSAMSVLCDLAEIRSGAFYALKLVLVSDRAIHYMTQASATECLAKRLTGDFHLEPMTMNETADYIAAKIRAGGCQMPEGVFPDGVCDEIHSASGGWPGIVDRLALLALADAKECPIEVSHIEHPVVPVSTGTSPDENTDSINVADPADGPVLFVTKNGKTLNQAAFSGTRLLIGRSEHNDITLESKFISRHHALLVRHGDATLLMDLNSANGTFVNSRRISNQVMLNDDIITIGDHGIKFVDSNAVERTQTESLNLNQTVVMKTLDDMRRVLARDNTEVVPAMKKAKKKSSRKRAKRAN